MKHRSLLAIILFAVVTLLISPGCKQEEEKLLYAVHSEGITLYASSQESINEVKDLLGIRGDAVLKQELDCIKGPSHIKVEGSDLEGAFDSLVDAGWDCVLILDD